MPLELEFQTTGADTTVRVPINASPQHAQFTIPDSATSMTVDPNAWLLKAYDVYYGIEEYVDDQPHFNELMIARNPSRTPEVGFVIHQPGMVQLQVYDVTGRIREMIYDGFAQPGEYSYHLPGLTPGIYFCRLSTPVNMQVKKLVVVK